jgi:hypothetical protein
MHLMLCIRNLCLSHYHTDIYLNSLLKFYSFMSYFRFNLGPWCLNSFLHKVRGMGKIFNSFPDSFFPLFLSSSHSFFLSFCIETANCLNTIGWEDQSFFHLMPLH